VKSKKKLDLPVPNIFLPKNTDILDVTGDEP
jgi:hypothetical protein